MKGLSITSLILSIIFLILGFYRLLVYSNPESAYSESRNAWVGGDAYNYIINAAQATAFFVLFAAFFLAFIVIKIGLKLQNTENKVSNSNLNINFDDKKDNFEDVNKW
ncbi:hypothetical protein P9B03_03820 [Metasolibacillus meyeri]|uniref:Uncharacterized protein n=1 Tax=Metasolibacillus meyeri TaxID=1071052 RepID=A0AAW9NS27_9BACL|nr:hypothetical protein [Metasolibacillus meyeri]MEC1177601.1 hypothetical protein [Metasolibacillus meyeri]